MAVRKLRNSWWVDFRHDYVRYRRRSPENSRVGAQAYEALLRQKLARGEPITSPKFDKAQKEREQKFKDFAWKWFETYVKNNNKQSEIHTKKYTLQKHLVPFFGDTTVDKITTLQVEQYKSDKRNARLTNKTINNQLTILGTCLRAAQEWLDLTKMPKIQKLKIPPMRVDFLSSEECDLLLAHAHGVWHDIILMALRTGLRRGELKALNWADINWDNKTLIVRRAWCDCKNGLDAPKSNKQRHVPLTDELYRMLMRRRRTTGLVFVDDRGQRVNSRRFGREIAKACERAGIRKITCHALRHTFASHLAMRGAQVKAIQELMGHADIQTTMRYMHLAPSSLRETVNLLESGRGRSWNCGQYMVNAG